MSYLLDRLRRAVREERYRISAHANEEMSDDQLESADIENIILTGDLERKLTHDPRGVRYVIRGKSTDGREAYVVCRFLADGVLVIITAFLHPGEPK